ncbi:MAG: DNA repair protein RadA [Syntrophales bacterium]
MKTDIIFICNECGKQLLKWMGRCPGCGEWNSIVEKQVSGTRSAQRQATVDQEPGSVVALPEIRGDSRIRLKTGIEELDRVLGGGLVNRSVVLVGGDPGIGKTTLLMQALGKMASAGITVLYISGEESSEQLNLRAERLGIQSGNFLVLVENDLDAIIEKMTDSKASVLVVDSVQAVYSRSFDGQPGGISQVRQVAGQILECVKRGLAACFIVGHVTKEGNLAGPKVLEHMVDTVLYFEGERGHPYRILRAVKNRFGSASEIGVFEMGDAGLAEVANPSEIFLSERPEDASGSAVTALVEGTRPILAEIQALVAGPVPGQGRRTCLGIDSQRLALMIAVVEKKLGFTLGDQDIFLNAVGGVSATEPAADLAIAAAMLSSFADKPIAPGTLVFGEVGLAGEVRRVSRASERINEAARLGFSRIICPFACAEQTIAPPGLFCIGISRLQELPDALFDFRKRKQ